MHLLVFNCNINEMVILIKNVSHSSDELNMCGDVSRDPRASAISTLVGTRRVEDEGVVELGLPALELHGQRRGVF